MYRSRTPWHVFSYKFINIFRTAILSIFWNVSKLVKNRIFQSIEGIEGTFWSCPVKKYLEQFCKIHRKTPTRELFEENISPAGIYLLKVNNSNSRTWCRICSNLTLRTQERRQWRRSAIFIVNFEHIAHLVLVYLLLILNI